VCRELFGRDNSLGDVEGEELGWEFERTTMRIEVIRLARQTAKWDIRV